MHLPKLLRALTASTLTVTALVACGGATTTEPPHSADAWRARAIEASRVQLTNMCMDVAPMEAVDLENPDFRECMRQATIAVTTERKRLHDNALSACLGDRKPEAGCCFERIANFPTEKQRQAECNQECAQATGRKALSGSPSSCTPIVVDVQAHPPSRFYTDAVKAVERRCLANPAASKDCDALNSKWERMICHAKCDPQAPPAPEGDAGVEADDEESIRPGTDTLQPR